MTPWAIRQAISAFNPIQGIYARAGQEDGLYLNHHRERRFLLNARNRLGDVRHSAALSDNQTELI